MIFALKHNFAAEEKKKLRKLFKYLVSKNLPGYPNPEIRTLALIFGYKREKEREFYVQWKLYMDSTSDFDKKILLKNLATFSDIKLNKINLENAFNQSMVKIQDGLLFLANILKQALTFKNSWEYVTSKWEILLERYGSDSELTEFLLNLVNFFDNDEKLSTILEFIKSKNYSTELLSIKRIYEKIEEKRQQKFHRWLKSHRCATEKWLHKHQFYQLKSNHYISCNTIRMTTNIPKTILLKCSSIRTDGSKRKKT
ncbi:hypothetical protein MXB_909 [Myxobolus squamalis]|nr:hypothetical protein MXB_909 [Myxobolus squamalis]